MKRNLLLLALLSLAKPAFAQHTELLGHAGLGLFQFAGKSAVSSSFINYSSYNGTEQGYTNSPYGSRLGTGFVLGGRLQRVCDQPVPGVTVSGPARRVRGEV